MCFGSGLLFFNRESDKRQAVNTRLSSPSEASVITKPHRMVKKKVINSYGELGFPVLHVCFSCDFNDRSKIYPIRCRLLFGSLKIFVKCGKNVL